MSPRKTPPDLPIFPSMPELSPPMQRLADAILAEGPASLVALFAYVMQKTVDDPRWNQQLAEAMEAAGLSDDDPFAFPAELDDGLIYKVKITLRGFRPAVSREVEVPNMTLGELHEIIQAAMGWYGGHLHAYRIGKDAYGPILPDDPFSSWEDEEHVVLAQLVEEDRRKILYEYDFGDGWEHDILISKPKPPKPGVFYPQCIKGELACPPEDCGGIDGYLDICDTLQTPKAEWDDEQKERMEWLGKYDPQAFSVEQVNALFREMYAPPEPPPKKSQSKKKRDAPR